jgi:predicted Zn-dependent protease
MPLTQLETGAIARRLSQIADRPGDHVDVFFEIECEEAVTGRAEALTPERRVETGLAVRLLRHGDTWLASRDEVTPEAFTDAVARVARARPGAAGPQPRSLATGAVAVEDVVELELFVAAVEEAVKRRHAAFPLIWDLRRRRRFSRVLGAMLAPEQQAERFFSCAAITPWGRWGSLLLDLESDTIERVADSLTSQFRARRAPRPASGRVDLVLGPAAAAVLLHEAVAHALESDTLALSGRPEAAIGVALGAAGVDVVDDPAGAPGEVARSADDEGIPVIRRWLLRGGVVEQLLTDLLRGAGSRLLIPGAARRGSRHLPPVPRSTHLELLAGTATREALIADCGTGLHIEEFSRGTLDPLSGRLRLEFEHGREIEQGGLGSAVGPGAREGTAAGVLAGIQVVGADSRPAGAGWCAKGGHRMPVWATAPSLLLSGIEIAP